MKIYLGSLVTILIATTISASDISPELIEKCRKTGEVARWGGYYDCDETCEGKSRKCHHVGMLRCFCPHGKVRITYLGRCIPPSECPARNGQKFLSNTFNRDISPELIEKCRKTGEVARWGGDEDCEETCEGSPRTCTHVAMLRCFCPNGKVRIKHGGRCIPPSECPARNGKKFLSNTFNRDIDPALVHSCLEAGEVVEWGKSWSCDETCEGKPRVCHDLKKEYKCACPKGKVRRKLRGACIPRSGCPERKANTFRSKVCKKG